MNPFHRSLLRFFALSVAFLGLSQASLAASSDWALNEGGRMRLIVTAGDEPGHYEGALQIEPKPGWITYWREPGDSGIPPEVKIKGGKVAVTGMEFPAPKRIDNGSLRDIGYDGPVTMPFRLEGPPDSAGTRLKAHVFIGICQNICIPFQADLSLKLPAASEPLDAIVIAKAREQLPEKPSKDFKVEAASRSAGNDVLTITLALPSPMEEPPQVFVTGPTGTVYMDYEAAKKEKGRLTLTMPISRLPEKGDPEGRTWRLLAVAGKRAMESPLAFD
ncbi:hypothetical protein M8R20_04275 [Pseudomonas sp. R2.Fl]|nr:hypothetical protein [Pseudomonas sp. R2.Fl]